MSNVIAGKAFQGKYVGLNSSWINLNVSIGHLDEIEDSTFSDMDPAKFKRDRRASLVFIDGIRLLNEKAIQNFGLRQNSVWVNFCDDYVKMVNNQIAHEAQISDVDTNHQVRIDWMNSAESDDRLINGHYYTTSESRGKTTQGQGAVDFLTVSALFGEALRNLLFDEEKNRISLIVLKRFIKYRRFYLSNKTQIVRKSLTVSDHDTFRKLIMELSDALYMSGAYFKSGNGFEKRHIDTRAANILGSLSEYDETVGEEIFEPEYLEKLLKAYV